MGFSIFKSFGGKYLKLNLTTSGVSVSVGPKGARLNYKLLGDQQGQLKIHTQKSLLGIPVRYRKTLFSNTSTSIRWSSKYGVGNRQLNGEHKQIIQEIQSLQHDTDLEAIIGRIIEQTRKHFHHEEEIMQQYNVPNYEEHKQAHDEHLVQLASIHPQQSYHELCKWWQEHLTTMDASYKRYLQKK